MEYDPVLEQHMVMAGGESASPGEPSTEHFPDFVSELGSVSRQVPAVLAVGAIVGVAGLFAFRMAGIRFAFGANIGGK